MHSFEFSKSSVKGRESSLHNYQLSACTPDIRQATIGPGTLSLSMGNSCTGSSLTAGRYAVVLLVSAYRPGSAGTSIRSSVVATCQATCAQLLVVLGTVHAEAAGQALGSMLEACFNPEATNPPEGLTEHIAEGLCKVAAGSGCASH